jgi:hypothetical protein
MKTTIQSTVSKATLANPALVVDAIRPRAYELYSQRGMAEGHAVNDSLQAETEVLNGSATTSSVEPTLQKSAVDRP